MLNTKVVRGQQVSVIKRQNDVWILMTPEEVQALRDKDKAAGRWHDDGGEPILYGPYMGFPEAQASLVLTVTSRRPKWAGYRRRPKGLRAGFSITLQREVLFQSV